MLSRTILGDSEDLLNEREFMAEHGFALNEETDEYSADALDAYADYRNEHQNNGPVNHEHWS